jgi:hypothetical protein
MASQHCGTCDHFTETRTARQWGDCLHSKPIVLIRRRENQHRDNGSNCPCFRQVTVQEVRESIPTVLVQGLLFDLPGVDIDAVHRRVAA